MKKVIKEQRIGMSNRPQPTSSRDNRPQPVFTRSGGGEGITYSVQKIPSGKFKIFVTTPTYKTPTDASIVFKGGTMWKEYNTGQEAQDAINSLKGGDGLEEQSSNKKVIKLTESDLVRLVKKVIKEQRLSRAGNNSSIISEEPVSALSGVAAAAAGVAALVGSAILIINGTGGSGEKVKKFTDLCKTSNAQITSNSNKIADTLRDAIQGIGTDEEAIYSVFKDNANPFTAIRTMNEFCSVVKAYESSYGETLYDDLDSELGHESEWNQIFRPLRDIALKEKEASKSQPSQGGGSNQRVSQPSQGGGSNQRVSQPTSPTSRTPVR
jgi:hypothetical protein